MRLAPAACIFVASFAVLGVHAGSHLPFLSDDALITLRYAGRLLEGHGLTWTDGPRVEGYSNLAWLLLCAGAGALGADRSLTVDDLEATPNACVIPGWAIDAIAVAVKGAYPSYAHGYYPRNNRFYKEWDTIARDRDTFQTWLDENVFNAGGQAQ